MADKSSGKPATDRRGAILTVAAAVFHDKGFQRATTLDIATAAGVSKRDLYALFPTKTALLEAIIRRSVDDIAAPLPLTPARSREAFYGALAAFGPTFLDLLLSPNVINLHRLAIAEAPNSATIGQALRDSGARRSIDLISDFVAAAEAAGHVCFANREAAIGAYFLTLMGDLQMRALLTPCEPISPDERARYVRLALFVLQRMEEPR